MGARCCLSHTPSAARTLGSSQPAGRNDMSKTYIIVRTRSDGTLRRVLPDGTERPMAAPGPLAPMTDEEVSPAAQRDPDPRPMTEEEIRRARRVPRTKTLRRDGGPDSGRSAPPHSLPPGAP